MKKRFYFSVVEEMVMNPAYLGYRGGRVEIYDRLDRNDGYSSDEMRFLIPEEFMNDFRNAFDGKESDKPLYINWNQDVSGFVEKK